MAKIVIVEIDGETEEFFYEYNSGDRHSIAYTTHGDAGWTGMALVRDAITNLATVLEIDLINEDVPEKEMTNA